jgi:UDPglucose 6-dehydrogenase
VCITGGPTAAVIALRNPDIRVTVVDRDEKRIRRWNSKHPPIYEPGLSAILRITRDGSREPLSGITPTESCETTLPLSAVARSPNLVFTTDVAACVGEADLVMIAVNTPTKKRGHGAGSATDMAAFEAVTAAVGRFARPGAIIVEKSTVPCRTAQLVKDTVSPLEPLFDFSASCPSKPRKIMF